MFRKVTVDSILEDLTVKIEQLMEVARTKNTVAEQQDQVIADAQVTRDEALEERERAHRVATKIRELVS